MHREGLRWIDQETEWSFFISNEKKILMGEFKVLVDYMTCRCLKINTVILFFISDHSSHRSTLSNKC